MGALAKDSTLKSVLTGLVGAEPERTAFVKEIAFKESQFESGYIDTTTGQNKNSSGFFRTSDYIALPQNVWKMQLLADKPWNVRVFYYDADKQYQKYQGNVTGYITIQNYPYCRIDFYNFPDYMSSAEFMTARLKIQYIENAPAKNEYFLHNCLFNGNFEFDRNNDGVADGWLLRNSPTSYAVEDGIQKVTPSTATSFLRIALDNRLTGHVIYCSMMAHTPYSICGFSVYGKTPCIVDRNTKFTRASGLVTAVNSSVVMECTCKSSAVGHEIQVKNIMMIDLTEIFGEGNEPAAEEIDAIVDGFYGGYVPVGYEVKYDDGGLPVSIMERLKHIDTSSDQLIVKNGAVTSVSHYVGGELKSKTIINRDKFGSLISVEEV